MVKIPHGPNLQNVFQVAAQTPAAYDIEITWLLAMLGTYDMINSFFSSTLHFVCMLLHTYKSRELLVLITTVFVEYLIVLTCH